MNREVLMECLDRRKHTAHELGDDRVDEITRRASELIADPDGRLASLLRDEIGYAVLQRDALDDETREPWQVLIDIDEEALEAMDVPHRRLT